MTVVKIDGDNVDVGNVIYVRFINKPMDNDDHNTYFNHIVNTYV